MLEKCQLLSIICKLGVYDGNHERYQPDRRVKGLAAYLRGEKSLSKQNQIIEGYEADFWFSEYGLKTSRFVRSASQSSKAAP